jgi:hypothetical protein
MSKFRRCKNYKVKEENVGFVANQLISSIPKKSIKKFNVIIDDGKLTWQISAKNRSRDRIKKRYWCPPKLNYKKYLKQKQKARRNNKEKHLNSQKNKETTKTEETRIQNETTNFVCMHCLLLTTKDRLQDHERECLWRMNNICFACLYPNEYCDCYK